MAIKILLEHHTPAVYDALRKENKRLVSRLASLEYDYKMLQIKYGAEIQYNNALCDLLRNNDIPYKTIFSHAERYKSP